jgi:hypothetical protein
VPVFSFILQDGSGWIGDQEGVELPDLEAAKAYAAYVARELMRRNEAKKRHCRLNVLDSEGELAVALPFVKVDRTLDHLSRPLRQTVEQLPDARLSLAETISDLKRLRLELRAMRARSQRRPYLIARHGRRL